MTLYLPVGISGSGKTTLAEKFFKPHEIVCPDEFRLRMTDDTNCQEENDRVFKVAHMIVNARVFRHLDVFFDATNLNLGKLPCPDAPRVRRFIIMAATFRTCGEQNAARERVVPQDVLVRQWGQYERAVEQITSSENELDWCYDFEFTRH